MDNRLRTESELREPLVVEEESVFPEPLKLVEEARIINPLDPPVGILQEKAALER